MTKTLARTGIETNIELTIFFMPILQIINCIKTYFRF